MVIPCLARWLSYCTTRVLSAQSMLPSLSTTQFCRLSQSRRRVTRLSNSAILALGLEFLAIA
ncbi:MAG: hypothetical protein K2W96_06130 [Gemmataceae bacterium]|nr:hypothetical protein [Gemmataceae bacterium]